jgi:hexosaminidase
MKNKLQFLLVAILLLFVGCTQPNSKHYPVTIIPAPLKMEIQAGAFLVNENTTLWLNGLNEEAIKCAGVFFNQLRTASGFPLKIIDEVKEKNVFELNIDHTINDHPEAYHLDVSHDKVKLTGSSWRGLFLGMQSLRQLLPNEVELENRADVEWLIPAVNINDVPRFTWRGMHLDVSRHFFSKQYIKQFLDYMALYKMNTFHWHLTDDQGWRIEIKKYPELTEKGAFREINNHDKVCNERAKENPDFVITPEFFKEVDGKKLYGGYYTQEDIKEIVAYAAARNIMVVPEIDMPGHFKAAIDNYPEVSCFGRPDWGHTFSSPLCAGNEEAYKLVENILLEVMELFPSPYMHIGADEVEKTNWKKCKKCQSRIKKEKLADEHELQSYFVHRIEKFINSKGKKMIGWDEILEGGMSESATMMYWRGWVPNAPKEAVEQGNDVIMSPTSHCYFDYEQNKGTLEHLYGFDPVPDGLTEEQAERIIGGQGNIWTEYIPSEARADYMAMPRMIALSEALWTPKEKKNWGNFFDRIGSHFNRLDVMMVNYRIPDIGGLYDSQVFINSDTISLTSQVEDQEIRYTIDGTTPTKNSHLYAGPIVVNQSMTFKARPFSKAGVGGDVLFSEFKKQIPIKSVELNKSEPGVECIYFEGKSWKNVSDIGIKDVKKGTYTLPAIVLPAIAKKRRTNYALKYKTYIKVDRDDVYTFSLLCDDAGVLKIGNQIVIDNDGMHAPVKKVGQIALTKGLHPLELDYIEGGGGGTLKLKILNENKVFTELDASVLYH